MKVAANQGEKCPMEGRPKAYITDAPEGAAVPDTPYYRRLINDGSLVEVAAAPAKPENKSTSAKGGQDHV